MIARASIAAASQLCGADIDGPTVLDYMVSVGATASTKGEKAMGSRADQANASTRAVWSRSSKLMRISLVLTPLVSLLAGCQMWSSGPACNDQGVKDVLMQLLDKAYAETKKMVDLRIQIEDVATIEQTSTRSSCKAMIRIYIIVPESEKDSNVTFGDQEEVIAYTAEATDRGRFLVTIAPRR